MSNSDLRLAFDEDPGNYDRWRPRYCDTLFSKITSFIKRFSKCTEKEKENRYS